MEMIYLTIALVAFLGKLALAGFFVVNLKHGDEAFPQLITAFFGMIIAAGAALLFVQMAKDAGRGVGW